MEQWSRLIDLIPQIESWADSHGIRLFDLSLLSISAFWVLRMIRKVGWSSSYLFTQTREVLRNGGGPWVSLWVFMGELLFVWIGLLRGIYLKKPPQYATTIDLANLHTLTCKSLNKAARSIDSVEIATNNLQDRHRIVHELQRQVAAVKQRISGLEKTEKYRFDMDQVKPKDVSVSGGVYETTGLPEGS